MDTLRIARILTILTSIAGILLGVLSGCTPSITQQTSTEPAPTISFTATEAFVIPTITDTAPSPSATRTPLPPRPAPVITPFTDATLPFQAFPVAEGQFIALVNGRVIDGTGAPAHLGWTVLIQGTRILAAGPDVELPAGTRVVDLAGQTLLPGMFDMHGHLYAYNGHNLTFESVASTFVVSKRDYIPFRKWIKISGHYLFPFQRILYVENSSESPMHG